jgi:hypothetical protein
MEDIRRAFVTVDALAQIIKIMRENAAKALLTKVRPLLSIN